MDESALVIVGSFRTRVEAELAQGALTAAGIDSVLTADDAGGQYLNLLVTSGVRLQVRPEDAPAARDVLERPADAGDHPA
jgi:hypothetical protein